MKKRKPVLVWLFSLLTGGIYLIYWLFSLIEEINAYNKKEKINYKKTVIKFSVVLSLFFILILLCIFFAESLSNNNTESMPVMIIMFLVMILVCWIVGVCWIVLILKTIWKIAVELRQIQIENNVISPIETSLSVILIFLYFANFIYLQSHINRTVEIIGEEKINTRKSKIFAMAVGIALLLFCLNSVFTVTGSIKNLNKEPVYSTDLMKIDQEEDTFFINNSGSYALWVNCDFEFYAGFSPLIDIKITRNELTIYEKQHNPLEAPSKINTVKKSINNTTSMRFRGRLDKINLETGEYKIIVNYNFDDKLIRINKYLFYIR
jgi:threonine/homoserine/homoserine lactone efflux protein